MTKRRPVRRSATVHCAAHPITAGSRPGKPTKALAGANVRPFPRRPCADFLPMWLNSAAFVLPASKALKPIPKLHGRLSRFAAAKSRNPKTPRLRSRRATSIGKAPRWSSPRNFISAAEVAAAAAAGIAHTRRERRYASALGVSISARMRCFFSAYSREWKRRISSTRRAPLRASRKSVYCEASSVVSR
jgi:hypothetical protein